MMLNSYTLTRVFKEHRGVAWSLQQECYVLLTCWLSASICLVEVRLPSDAELLCSGPPLGILFSTAVMFTEAQSQYTLGI